MEKAIELRPNGIVSVWAYKAVLPEVVSIMHGLSMWRSLSFLFIMEWGRRKSNDQKPDMFFSCAIRLSICRKFGVVQDGIEQLASRPRLTLLSNNKRDSSLVQKGTSYSPVSCLHAFISMLPLLVYAP